MHKDDEGRRKVTENFTGLVPHHDGKGRKGTKSEVPRQYNRDADGRRSAQRTYSITDCTYESYEPLNLYNKIFFCEL